MQYYFYIFFIKLESLLWYHIHAYFGKENKNNFLDGHKIICLIIAPPSDEILDILLERYENKIYRQFSLIFFKKLQNC